MLSIELVTKAFDGAMKGKKFKNVPTSMAFMLMHNKEYYISEVGRILEERAFRPKKPRESIRIDAGSGKERHIQAPALFPDQIVHWCIVLTLMPIFMTGMDHWSCASVKGRGTLYAKNFIERELDNSLGLTGPQSPEYKYKYCLKMDIRKFFESINREILMSLLEKKIKDKEMLDICRKIIYSVPGTGLPLGFFTSQWLANFYLQKFDHDLREKIMPKYGIHFYVRYADDMIILGSNKRKMMELLNEINEYLKTNLDLELKNTSRVFAIKDTPIDFIGYRFSYGKTTLRKRTLIKARKANARLYGKKFTIKSLKTAMAYNGWMKTTDTKQYRAKYMKGSPYLERSKISELDKIEHNKYLVSYNYNRLKDLDESIDRLRSETELGDGHVLIRYYDNTDEVRVVARSRYKFPDEDSYYERLKEEEQKEIVKSSKSKNYKHKKGRPYMNTAEGFINQNEKEIYRRYYNLEMAQYETSKELEKVQYEA